MIKIFEDMFGAIFWSQAVIVLTHLPMDSWSTESLTNRPMHSCNYEQQPLPVSASEQGCTKTTIFEIVIYNYNRDSHMSLTDTIGFDDPKRETDALIILNLVIKLKTKCDFANVFVIAVNGQDRRLDVSFIGIIKIFEDMFGAKFWSQAVIVLTHLPMDSWSTESLTNRPMHSCNYQQ